MKLTIERSAALKLLTRVQSIAPSRFTIPIIGNAFLEAREGALSATTTDLDMQATAEAPAHVAEPGQITVSASRLFDVVRALPEGGEIAIIFDPAKDHRLIVQCGRSRHLLPVLPSGDFPVMTVGDLRSGGEIAPDALKRLIERTRSSCGVDQTRYYLMGAFFHTFSDAGQTSLRSTSTDGHRLAVADTDLPEGFSEWPGIIVPNKMLDEMRRALGDTKAPVELRTNGQRIGLTTDGVELISKLVDGTFPDYVRVIPRDNAKAIDLDVDLFGAVVNRAQLVSDDKVRGVRLAFEAGRLNVSCRGGNADEASEDIDVDYDGEPIVVGFNAKYVKDMLGHIQGEKVTLRLDNPSAPALALDSGDPRAMHVLMPLRV